MRRPKAQSALEYLITYWWAVLIVAVILGLVFYLGIFNSTGLEPKAQPGACQVYRPFGPYSNQQIRFEGLCSNQLPESVVEFNGMGGAWTFACASLGTCINITPPYSPSACINNQTVVAWSYDLGMGSAGALGGTTGAWTGGSSAVPAVDALGGVVAVFNTVNTEGSLDIEYNDTILRYEYRNTSERNQYLLSGNFKDAWVQSGLVVANGVAYGYLDGQQVTTNSLNIGCIVMSAGSIGIWDRNFYGYITNIQMYNTSLTSNQMAELYDEGIGGDPIQLQNLVGWWPLNQDPNDYSGDLNNGQSSKIIFSGLYPTPSTSG